MGIFFYIILSVFVIPLALAALLIYKNGFNHRDCTSKRKLHGKTALVTGASAGIGTEVARDLASRGARVILACRNVTKAQRVADSIIESSANKNVEVYQLDTSDMQSVRDCAKQILQKEKRLDILVNNAGIGGRPRREMTKDGFELTMATNYYGHFLLTNLLLDLMKKSAPVSRIVTVSSEWHVACLSLDPNNLNFNNRYCNQITTYSQSKLCNILFTLELSRKLKGTGVTANVLHPGISSTEIIDKGYGYSLLFMKFVTYLIGRTAKSGAQTTIYVAISEDVENVSGKYFDNCEEGSPSKKSQDIILARRLWDATVRDVKLEPDEIHY